MPTEPDSSSASRGITGEAEETPVIPDHTLLRQIARGSYGEVWLAQGALGTLRAAKIVRRGRFTESRPYERELEGLRNYEPVSREHEGLVDVLQVGSNEHEGFFYCVMELADDAAEPRHSDGGRGDGVVESWSAAEEPEDHCSITPPRQRSAASYVPRTLARELKLRSPLPVAEVVTLGVRLAQALEFLHSRGLVHRDLKPSNIIFISDQPKLADVGTVTGLDETISYVGTPGYMPPEGPGTVRADLYSLGKILYEAATGKDRQEFPDLPAGFETRETAASLLELNEVLVRACHGDPNQRYGSAIQMLADLRKLEQGRSLRAARARRQLRRRVLTATAALFGLSALAALVYGLGRLHSEEIFTDDFRKPQLDTNRWTWATKAFPGVGNSGKHRFRVEQINRELVIEAGAQHEGGRTTTGAAWVDTRQDLHANGECKFLINASGSSAQGYVTLSISDGSSPLDYEDRTAVQLLPGLRHWGHGVTEVQILQKQQAAIVYPDANIRENFEIRDLSQLRSWHLRFFAAAQSSEGHDNGLTILNLKKVSAFREPSPGIIVGRVVTTLSGRPVAGAIIRDADGMRLAESRANGAFKLTALDKTPKVIVEQPDYTPLGPVTLVLDATNAGFREIALSKQSLRYGDVTEAIPYADFIVKSIGFRGTNLWALAQQGSEYSLLPVDFTTKRLSLPGFALGTNHQGFGPAVECGDRLLCPTCFPGTIYDLTMGTPVIFMRPIVAQDGAQINWVWSGAFDGSFLWLLENDMFKTSGVGLHALDLASRSIKHWLPGTDSKICGLAWDPGLRWFWVSTGDDRVFPVRQDDALEGRSLDAGVGREFVGSYDSLTFGNGSLWGLDTGRKRICRIKTSN